MKEDATLETMFDRSISKQNYTIVRRASSAMYNREQTAVIKTNLYLRDMNHACQGYTES